MKFSTLKTVFFIYTLSLFTYCAVNPVSGKKQVVLISEEQELAMGREADPQIIAEYGLYPDSNMQRFMNQQGQAMAKISHRPNITYHFRMLDSDVINAFALPGGYVYFTRGIIAHMNNEAQFAGVLGHEIGHITARHTVTQQTNQTLAQLGLMVAVISDKRLAQFAETAGQGLELLFLKYSRDDERQSDELGVQYSSKVGYDAKEMAKFFVTLQRESNKSASTLPEFLSTHPDPGNRVTTVNKLATEFQTANNLKDLKINRNNFLRMMDGMVYGADPRQGYLENNIFYHPELRIQFNTPASWVYSNTPSQVTFAPKDGSAVFFLKLAKGSSPEAAAQAFIQGASFKVSTSKALLVNGLNAYAIEGNQMTQSQTGQSVPSVRSVLYFIQFNDLIYEVAGASTPEKYATYRDNFLQYINSFRQITDASKLNRKPELIRLKTINKTMTLNQALTSYAVPTSRQEEMAILNGMQLTDQLAIGTIIKVAERK